MVHTLLTAAMKTFPAYGMVITDLDGTLLNSQRQFSPVNYATLEHLGRERVLRVIATGRSLYSARKVIPPTFPLDFLIFSSGAGIMDWRAQRLLVAHQLSSHEISAASHLLMRHQIDFMLHHPIPDNHHFWYYWTGQDNPDFWRRYELYQEFACPLEGFPPECDQACQIVAIEPTSGLESRYETIRAQLPALKVIRATSPLDGQSTWIEIFPVVVSKALAGEWLAKEYDTPRDSILGLGNDYNDLDLLRWSAVSIVVDNAPDELKSRYRCVCSHDEDGFSEAVNLWTMMKNN